VRGGLITRRVTRIGTHAVVLAIAIALASYSSVSHGLPSGLLRLGVANAQARSTAQGGQVHAVMLDRDGVLMKPMDMPSSMPVRHDPISYTVAQGEDLKAIATRYNLSVDEIRWSNPSLGTSMKVHEGQGLVIPPVAGVVVQVRRGDTVQSLASVWHVDPVTIRDYNYLRDGVELAEGRMLVLPAGRGSTLTPQPTGVYLPAAIGSHATFTIKVAGTVGPYAVSRFPWGQCTYLVATKVQIPFNGNAWQWYGNAQAIGWQVGSTPRPGSVMVTWESRVYGHVAYVEKVNDDGSWIVTEMNWLGVGVIDQRTVKPGQVPLIGFIYPPH